MQDKMCFYYVSFTESRKISETEMAEKGQNFGWFRYHETQNEKVKRSVLTKPGITMFNSKCNLNFG